MIDSVIKKFDLNLEQERAFRIVANHATIDNLTQLKMYLGGMGRTGKSQVLKALMEFFKERNESHRIIILAPTGSAAALLNGSLKPITLS
jgi:tRNA G37 N-methylase TrmD